MGLTPKLPPDFHALTIKQLLLSLGNSIPPLQLLLSSELPLLSELPPPSLMPRLPLVFFSQAEMLSESISPKLMTLNNNNSPKLLMEFLTLSPPPLLPPLPPLLCSLPQLKLPSIPLKSPGPSPPTPALPPLSKLLKEPPPPSKLPPLPLNMSL